MNGEPKFSSPLPVPESTSPQPSGPEPAEAQVVEGGRGAFWVAAGILLSRLVGLVRERVFAHYFGSSMAAGAFKAAIRIPNVLQNLFGEGVLSASFIPVYAQLIGRGQREEADQVAGAVFALLTMVTALLVGFGLLLTPLLIDVIAPGLHGESRELTIQLVRILFPGTGVLVLSAWCLGILNSHRRFFLAYAAPVIWSGAQIAALIIFGRRSNQEQLAKIVAVGAVVGSLLQFAIQLPSVLWLLGRFRLVLSIADESVRRVLHSFPPVLLGRGVVQVSAFVDTAYASLISERALAALSYAQTLYLMPVSLFGMSVSAAELPAMSQATGTSEDVSASLRVRVNEGLGRIAFFVVPCAASFLFLGDVVGGALLQTGKFGPSDTRYVWYLLMGSTIGLLASALGRLYASTFYALKDTRTPLKFAALRVLITAILGYETAVLLPSQLGLPRELGAVGITASSGLAAWLEFLLLRRRIAGRIGTTGLPGSRMAQLWGCAALSAGVALAIKVLLVQTYGPHSSMAGNFLPPPALSPVLTAILTGVPFGVLYLGSTFLLGIPQSRALLRKH